MKRELYIKSEVDRHRLHVLILTPENQPRAVVQICHGMSEHKERYLPFMEYLQNRGYAAVIHDHRGHGKSIEREDDIFTTPPDGPLWRMPIRLRSGSKWSSPACLSIYLGTVWGL